MKYLYSGANTPNYRHSSKSYLLAASIFTILGLISSPVVRAQETSTSAQSTTTTTPAPTNTVGDKKEVERIEVIGTRLRRMNTEGPSAVKSIKKEQMEAAGNTTVSDSLRDMSSSSFGVTREEAGGSAAATSNIGLRGLGATRTLVLLNGQRLPKDPSTEAVDLNLIPQSAIERVEILKDGASALYGSDALGGVINIVTKKNFTGNEFSIHETMPERPGGSNLNTSLLTGVSSDKSDLLVVFNFNRKEKLFGKDRDVTLKGLSPTGSTPVYQDASNVYTISPTADCPADLLRDAPTGVGKRCYFRYNEIATTRPLINQLSLLTDYNYRLDSGWKFSNRNIFVNKDIEWIYAPAPMSIPTSTGTDSIPTAKRVIYRDLDAGNRDNQDSERNYSTMFGLKGNVSDIWEVNMSLGFSQVSRMNLGVNGYLDLTSLQKLIADRTYDPLKPLGSRGDISPAKVETFQKSVSELATLDVVFSGEIGELANGPISTAVGVSAWNEKLAQKTDTKTASGVVVGGAGSNDSGTRDVQSVYTEFSLPATQDLELNLAARADKYSDFGTAINPKLAAKYKLNESALVRASVGTGFKAPTLQQLYSAKSDGFPEFIDRFACARSASACQSSQYRVLGGGNKDLKEEKAITGGIGAVYETSSNFSMSADLWYTKISNVVGIDLEELTVAELNGVNPADYGVTTNRDIDGFLDENNPVVAPNLNLQEEEISGLDVNVSAKIADDFLGHKLTLEEDLGYLVFYKNEGFPGAGKRNKLGEWGYPSWRNNFSATMSREQLAYTLGLRTVPGQNVVDRLENQKINDMNEFDLTVVYKHSKTANFQFGVRNLLDSEAPNDPDGGTGGAAVINTSLYDVNRRVIFAGYNQKF